MQIEIKEFVMNYNHFKSQFISYSKAVVFLTALLALQGCMTSLIRETGPEHQAMLDVDVNTIGNVSLESFSQDKPITIEEGTQRQKEETLEREAKGAAVELSLADVRAAALSNNLDLKVELVNPSLAREKWMEERAKFEAAFYGGIQYSDSQTPASSQLEGSKSTMLQYEIGVQQPLPTGGKFKIGQPSGRYETNNQFSLLNPAYETDLNFSLSQPLLRGAGFSANTHSIRVARLQGKMADAQTKLQAIRFLAEADRAYWKVYGASQALQVSQQQYQIALRQLEEAKMRV